MAASVPLAGVTLLLLLLHAGVMAGLSGAGGERMTSSEGYVPVRTVVYRPAAVTAGAYEPFRVCRQCRCCPAGAGTGNDSSSCVDTQCCYGINCNLPGKPFGTCGFTPRTCGCGAAATAGNSCMSAPAPPS